MQESGALVTERGKQRATINAMMAIISDLQERISLLEAKPETAEVKCSGPDLAEEHEPLSRVREDNLSELSRPDDDLGNHEWLIPARVHSNAGLHSADLHGKRLSPARSPKLHNQTLSLAAYGLQLDCCSLQTWSNPSLC